MKDLKIIDTRFLLTPFAKTIWTVKGVTRHRFYLFGFKIIDIAQNLQP